MSETINKIKERVKKFSEIKIIEENENFIVVKPDIKDSFKISFIINNGKYSVHFEGWSSEYDTEEEALDCFAFGLSDDCRLKVISYGGIDCKWVLEVKDGKKWLENSSSNIKLVPFWQKKKITCLQNPLIKHDISK